MATIDTAYGYYLSTYASKSASRYDTHKKSELRNIYNTIVKINKESPLYKIQNTGDVQRFAIDIKENARNIKNVVASLSDDDDITKAFQKKIAFSTQEDIVSANYIGTSQQAENIHSFQIEVQQLAQPQVNLGSFLTKDHLDLRPDTYAFDLSTNSAAYEFQFTVASTDSNYDVQEKIANLITNSGINLQSSVIEDSQGRSAIRIESANTGRNIGEEYLFNITPQGNHNSMTALNVLGIDRIVEPSQNAEFVLDGKKRSSFTNTFSINNAFELTLHSISEEDNPATIGFKTNVDAIADNIQTLVDSYNNIIETSDKYSESQPQSALLYHDMSSAAFALQNDLEALGLMVSSNGEIFVDKALLADAVDTEHPDDSFSVLNDFKNLLDKKATTASLDPMKYVDKVVVVYKNPNKTLVTPYITSIYSGMMMDRYC